MARELAEARKELRAWGSYWRHRQQDGHGYSGVSPMHSIVEIGRLGCRVQKTCFVDRTSDEYVPPAWIGEIDKIVEGLTRMQQAALSIRYIQQRPANATHLLRGEMAVAEALREVFEDAS